MVGVEMKVLILGASGFIGSHVFAVLASKNYDYKAPNHKELDLCDPIAINKYLDKYQPDVIINCAWLPRGNNVLLTEQLLAKDIYLVNIGSGVEKTLHNEKWKEYAEEKKKIAKMLRGKRAVNLRCFGVYGERDNSERFIPWNIQRRLEGRPVEVHNRGYMDFIYIDDLVRIIEKFIEMRWRGEFDAVSTERLSFFEIAMLIIEATEGHCLPMHIMDKRGEGIRQKPYLNQDYVGDGSKLHKKLGGHFIFVPMVHGLRNTVAWATGHDEDRLSFSSFRQH